MISTSDSIGIRGIFFRGGKVIFPDFVTSPFYFQFSTFPFSNFLLFFSIFLASLLPVGQQKFPGEKCGKGGGHSAPAVTPLFDSLQWIAMLM